MGFNSSIPVKMGECIDCNDGIDRYLIAGRCQSHYKRHRAKVNQEKKKKRLSPTDALEKTFGMGKPQSELFLFYADCIKQRTGYCMECGAPIPLKYAQHSIAHIVQKAYFKSVATHKSNWLELGAGCGCHNSWDRSWDSAQKMKVFSIGKERFRQFEPLIISREERKRIPECLLND